MGETGLTVRYYVRVVYGRRTMYIVDGDTARAVSELTGRKVLTESNKRAFESLGFSFHEVMEPRKDDSQLLQGE